MANLVFWLFSWVISRHFPQGFFLRKKVWIRLGSMLETVIWGVSFIVISHFPGSQRGTLSKSGKNRSTWLLQIFLFSILGMVAVQFTYFLLTAFLFKCRLTAYGFYNTWGRSIVVVLLCRQKPKMAHVWLNISHLIGPAQGIPFGWPHGSFATPWWLALKHFFGGITFRSSIGFLHHLSCRVLRKFSPPQLSLDGPCFLGGLIMVANHETLGDSRDLAMYRPSLLLDY